MQDFLKIFDERRIITVDARFNEGLRNWRKTDLYNENAAMLERIYRNTTLYGGIPLILPSKPTTTQSYSQGRAKYVDTGSLINEQDRAPVKQEGDITLRVTKCCKVSLQSLFTRYHLTLLFLSSVTARWNCDVPIFLVRKLI